MKQDKGLWRLGSLFIFLAIAGMLFAILGTAATWMIKPKLQRSLFQFLDSFETILITTGDGLVVMNNTIETTKDNLDSIENTMDNIDDTFISISDAVEEAAILIGDDLRLTILNTQTALNSSASSAKIIDNTLSILASISFGLADYQPEVPLHISLEQVADGLEEIPESLESIEQNMSDTAQGLNVLKSDLNNLTDSIVSLDSDLQEAQAILTEYDAVIAELLVTTNAIRNQSPLYFTLLALIITGVFLWLGIAQINILLHGLAYRHGEQTVVNLADMQRE